MEYEKCYVYQPEDNRPEKRQRTEPQGLHASWWLRKKAYQQEWQVQQDRISSKLKAINATTVTEIAAFLDDAISLASKHCVPAGLILGGPDSVLRTNIASQIVAAGNGKTRRIFVPLSSSSGFNLKSALRTLIAKATSRIANDDDDDELDESGSLRKGPRLLNHDLQALYDYVRERKIQQIVIVIEDTEAFDSDLLSELVEVFGCWRDRIPFACLFNIATSVEFLQQRLTKAAVKCLAGRLFDAALSAEEIEQVLGVLIAPESPVWLGAGLASAILERQQDFIQSIDSLVQAAHYAYMSCFYANALSIFLIPDLELKDVPEDHFEAMRNLKSFQEHARKLLDNGNTKQLRTLLDSDKALFEFALQSVADGQRAIADAVAASEIIRALSSSLPNITVSSKSRMYVQTMKGNLAESPVVRSLLISLRMSPSTVALDVVKNIVTLDGLDELTIRVGDIADELHELIREQADSTQPLRSEDDVKNSTLRTTVIAQKVELSKQKSTLSKQDAAYTTIIRKFSDLLEAFLREKLVDPKDLVLHEIFVYDLKSPYREVFTPRPRHAIERALAAPHDYLDCDCCAPEKGTAEEATLVSSQPATAVLYQLCLESGSLINASDLWQAFQAVLGEREKDGQRTTALFQRGLAELRYLGFVKNTRKRVDHVAKVAWRGL